MIFHLLPVIAGLFMLGVTLSSNAQPIFKCVNADGSVVFSNVPCVKPGGASEFLGIGSTQQEPISEPSQIGQLHAGKDLDSSARVLGFSNYQHFLHAKEVCISLLKSNPLIGRSCGADAKCFQEEGAAMRQRFLALSQTGPWLTNNCGAVVRVLSTVAGETGARDEYVIEEAFDDEKFLINGSVFEAQSYCMDLNEGDRVIFVSGSPHGACSNAEVVNVMTGSKCSLWCE